MIKKVEIVTAQRECEHHIKKIGYVKILVLPENFAGLDRTEDLTEMSFADRSNQFVGKIAITGKPEWRDLVYSFVGKGLRQVSIRYFKQDQETAARLWLNIPQ